MIFILITFSWGLHFKLKESKKKHRDVVGLNPFFIRSTFQTGRKPKGLADRRLNPFFIRSTFQTNEKGEPTRLGRSLNPFFIRSTFQTGWAIYRSFINCLNPFFIRSTFQTPRYGRRAGRWWVLIPFSSGLHFKPTYRTSADSTYSS